MDATELLQALLRWIHVVAGIIWIGHLYFFNWVNGPFAATMDGDTKKKVVPQLMPRALYWFRWGAAYTWVTGILLLAFVYYMGGSLVPQYDAKVTVTVGSLIGLGVLVVGFVIYDIMWKALAKQEMLGMVISFLLVVAVAYGLGQVFIGRAVWIHIGALLGTIMAANVWMRIWPNQKRIIAATKEGKAPDPAWAALAGLRSKHNTYMSMPLMLMMVSNHYTAYLYGTSKDELYVPGYIALTVAVGWAIAKLCFMKSATKAPALYGAPEAAPAAPAEAKK